MASAMIYTFLKKTLKKLIPSKLLNDNEEVIRGIVYQFYKGKTYKCNICEASLRKFIGDEAICPKCGSLPRGRRLFSLLETEVHKRADNPVMLHLSPSKSLKKKIGDTFKNVDYHTSDYVGEFDADNSFDLRKTNLGSNKYDIIICYHILEHIIEDMEAIKELYRILKKGGVCYIQTPFCSVNGASKEDYDIVTPEERLKHFGQIDHVRVYSVSDLQERLSLVGFETELVSFQAEVSVFGYKEMEYIVLGLKT